MLVNLQLTHTDSCRNNSIAKLANSAYDGAGGMDIDGRCHGEYDGVGFVEISSIFSWQDDFFMRQHH